MREGNPLVEFLDESANLETQSVGIAAEQANTFLGISKMDELGTGVMEEVNFLVENSEEDFFRPVSRLQRRTHQRDGHRGCQRSEVIGDFSAANFPEHPAHPLIENLNWEELER